MDGRVSLEPDEYVGREPDRIHRNWIQLAARDMANHAASTLSELTQEYAAALRHGRVDPAGEPARTRALDLGAPRLEGTICTAENDTNP